MIIIPEMILIWVEYLINLLKLILDIANAIINIVNENPAVNSTKLTVLYKLFPVDALYAIKAIKYAP